MLRGHVDEHLLVHGLHGALLNLSLDSARIVVRIHVVRVLAISHSSRNVLSLRNGFVFNFERSCVNVVFIRTDLIVVEAFGHDMGEGIIGVID